MITATQTTNYKTKNHPTIAKHTWMKYACVEFILNQDPNLIVLTAQFTQLITDNCFFGYTQLNGALTTGHTTSY